MSKEAPVSFGPFVKGVNNRLADHELGSDMLRQAENGETLYSSSTAMGRVLAGAHHD